MIHTPMARLLGSQRASACRIPDSLAQNSRCGFENPKTLPGFGGPS